MTKRKGVMRIIDTTKHTQPSEMEHAVQSQTESVNNEDALPDADVTNDEGEQRPKRKLRGPTRSSEVWSLGDGKRMLVRFNDINQPCGEDYKRFITFLGSIVRISNLAPVNILDWRELAQRHKDDMWKIIESKCIFFNRKLVTGTKYVHLKIRSVIPLNQNLSLCSLMKREMSQMGKLQLELNCTSLVEQKRMDLLLMTQYHNLWR